MYHLKTDCSGLMFSGCIFYFPPRPHPVCSLLEWKVKSAPVFGISSGSSLSFNGIDPLFKYTQPIMVNNSDQLTTQEKHSLILMEEVGTGLLHSASISSLTVKIWLFVAMCDLKTPQKVVMWHSKEQWTWQHSSGVEKKLKVHQTAGTEWDLYLEPTTIMFFSFTTHQLTGGFLS